MIGQTVAHYRITEKIGAGGMGEVFLARDEKLNRDVALKILPEIYTKDAQRMGRFQREAQVLASLNHANIAAIYGLEAEGAVHALVLELVDGEDLAQMVEARALPVEDVLDYAVQIAEALEAAHESGVIHRDLKPANVKVTPDGKVKVLDFGLAKALAGDPDASGAELSQSMSPTMTVAATGAGLILGTAAYMSPEQARGKPVDRRADIWSFGALLYEMFTRKQLFAGETVSDTLASVIKDEPDWSLIPADVHPVVLELMKRCLVKDPRRRLQSVGEARIALENVIRDPSGAASMSMLGSHAEQSPGLEAQPEQRGTRSRTMVWAAALVVVAVAAGFVGMQVGAPEVEPRARKFHLDPAELVVAYPTQPVISPDGRRVAYFASASLHIRDLESLESIEIVDTGAATAPFWSPDGNWLAFGQSGRLYKVPAVGGTPVAVCDVPFGLLDGGCWDEEGTLYLAPNSGPLYVVASRGGDPRVLFPQAAGESDYHTPTALPGGRGIVYTVHNEAGRQAIEVFTDGERKPILEIDGARLEYAAWAAGPEGGDTGFLVYHRMSNNRGIWAVPFSLDRLEIVGEPFILDPEGSYPSVASDGSLLYSEGSGGGPQQLVLVNRQGQILEEISQPQLGIAWPRLSPSGRYVLVSANDAENQDIWLHDIERGTRTRMTFGNENDWVAAWWGSDDEITYANGSAQTNVTWQRPVDGSTEPVRLVDGYHVSMRPGLDVMAFTRFGPETGDDLFVQELDGSGEARPFIKTSATETCPQISPDGRHVIYMSNESGSNEVYLTTFPSGGGKWQVSTDGGVWPKWSRDGSEIIYRTRAGGVADMMAVSVETDPEVRLGTPVRLFGAAESPDLAFGLGQSAYEPTDDPNVLLMVRYAGDTPQHLARLIYVENWLESWREDIGR
jgi:serine/threonine-protein kinase